MSRNIVINISCKYLFSASIKKIKLTFKSLEMFNNISLLQNL